jgi:hypothetical protein
MCRCASVCPLLPCLPCSMSDLVIWQAHGPAPSGDAAAGRIHMAPLKAGAHFFPFSITVLDQNGERGRHSLRVSLHFVRAIQQCALPFF